MKINLFQFHPYSIFSFVKFGPYSSNCYLYNSSLFYLVLGLLANICFILNNLSKWYFVLILSSLNFFHVSNLVFILLIIIYII